MQSIEHHDDRFDGFWANGVNNNQSRAFANPIATRLSPSGVLQDALPWGISQG
jgi:hypothetical protein